MHYTHIHTHDELWKKTNKIEHNENVSYKFMYQFDCYQIRDCDCGKKKMQKKSLEEMIGNILVCLIHDEMDKTVI